MAEALADELGVEGLEVELEVIGYTPGRRALSAVEWTSIFIGTNVATTVIANLTTDLYNRTKRMLIERKQSKEPGLLPGRTLGFVIYGPHGEEIRRWTTEGDHGSDGDEEAHLADRTE
jgi:hypothetical protein